MQNKEYCEICGVRWAIKTDSKSRAVCKVCATGGVTTLKKNKQTGRNELCPCGSGSKFKKCCGTAKPAKGI